jgi:hypothetical protein
LQDDGRSDALFQFFDVENQVFCIHSFSVPYRLLVLSNELAGISAHCQFVWFSG